MSYNDGIRTATTGLNIADSAKAGGGARLNYETGVNPNDLGNAGTIAQGLMDWANKGGEAAMARKQNEEVNKRIKAAEEKKAREDLDLRNKYLKVNGNVGLMTNFDASDFKGDTP